MAKSKKIDVITVKLTCHIAFNPTDRQSVNKAYATADRLLDDAVELGQTTGEVRVNRVTAPEPAPSAEPEPEEDEPEPADDLDLPANLDRRAETA